MSEEPAIPGKREFPLRYYVVREKRPHTDAPHIIRERYLTAGGDLDSNFVVAMRFNKESAAAEAMYRHGVKIANQHQHYPAPPATELEVIECDFKSARKITVADVISAEQED